MRFVPRSGDTPARWPSAASSAREHSARRRCRTDRMLRLVTVVATATLALAAIAVGLSRSSLRPSARTVPCSEIIDQTNWPYRGSSDPRYRYRSVLGVVSVPPAYISQVVRLRDSAWPYWSKAGLVVRAGRGPVTVSVPSAWRRRAAITWGGNTGIVNSLRILRCGSNPSHGNAYAGGFYLRSRSACLPLIFRAGGHSMTVRFGLGRRCR